MPVKVWKATSTKVFLFESKFAKKTVLLNFFLKSEMLSRVPLICMHNLINFEQLQVLFFFGMPK